jgi:predicted aspartyl protease
LGEAIAQLALQSQQAIFDKPSQHRHLKALHMKGFINGKSMTKMLVDEGQHRHLKALHMKGFINGKSMTKMLVDEGATVNLLPYTTFRKLGKSIEDLFETVMMLKDFGGNASKTWGQLTSN